jgi:hypothetical protein
VFLSAENKEKFLGMKEMASLCILRARVYRFESQSFAIVGYAKRQKF